MHIALITGAASGLGWALARAYHAQGYGLLLTDINASGLATRVTELGADRVIGLAGDITDPALHQQLLQYQKRLNLGLSGVFLMRYDHQIRFFLLALKYLELFFF